MKHLFLLLFLTLAAAGCTHRGTTTDTSVTDTCTMTDSVNHTWDWQMSWGGFKDSIQCATLNRAIHAEDDYDQFMTILAEYYPIDLPSDATPYQQYCASRQQFDSLIAFDGDGCTIVIYMYQGATGLFSRVVAPHMHEQLSQLGIYTIAEDSAWNQYMRAMSTVVDSVVMCRPCGQGTISGLEYIAFMMELRDQHLAMMETELYYRDPHYPILRHMTITDAMIDAAYEELRANQKLHEYEMPEYFEDVIRCEVPIPERQKAIDADVQTWTRLMFVRDSVAKQLPRKYRSGYQYATNELKREKLIMLKNRYREHNLMCDDYYQTLLPHDCSDSLLLRYYFSYEW